MAVSTDFSIPFELLDTEVVIRAAESYTVVVIASSKGDKEYRVDVTNGRCSCPGWKFAKADPSTGLRKHCKHLRQFGYSEYAL
jgi:hypothetical protein